MQLDVKYQTPREVCAIWGPVVLRLVDGAPTEQPDIDRIHVLLEELLAAWPSVGMLVIAHHGNPTPSLATLRYSKQLMDRFEQRLVVGITLLGLGFWAEAARASADLFIRLARGSTVALESSVEQAVRRMALELVGIDGDGLRAACAELELRLRTRE